MVVIEGNGQVVALLGIEGFHRVFAEADPTDFSISRPGNLCYSQDLHPFFLKVHMDEGGNKGIIRLSVKRANKSSSLPLIR